ncbi:hypothetical protein ACFWEB_13510 [Streptomyces parvus]|uniref:hypothetical protein n=1 Tax=Streptomyces parvus TaxID=66428 RepID=UPI0036530155
MWCEPYGRGGLGERHPTTGSLGPGTSPYVNGVTYADDHPKHAGPRGPAGHSLAPGGSLDETSDTNQGGDDRREGHQRIPETGAVDQNVQEAGHREAADCGRQEVHGPPQRSNRGRSGRRRDHGDRAVVGAGAVGAVVIVVMRSLLQVGVRSG